MIIIQYMRKPLQTIQSNGVTAKKTYMTWQRIYCGYRLQTKVGHVESIEEIFDNLGFGTSIMRNSLDQLTSQIQSNEFEDFGVLRVYRHFPQHTAVK